MKLHKFKDNDEYLSTQIERGKQRSASGWVRPKVIKAIANYVSWSPLLTYQMKRLLCHGVSGGEEMRLFKKHIPWLTEVVGTDLVKQEPPVLKG